MSISRSESTSSNSSPSKQKLPMPIWDSSDPTRNPPPMPLHPESPTLQSTSSSRPASPVRSMHARNLSALAHGDERVTEILDVVKKLKDQTQSVEDSVREALLEFGGLAHRSRDNGVALSHLKDHVKKTQQASSSTESAVKDNLNQVKCSLDTQKENQKSLLTVTDGLLEATRDINRQLQKHDSHFRQLLSKTSNGSGANNDEIFQAVEEITGQLEYRNGAMMEVLQGVKAQMPDNEYLLDVIRQRMDRTAEDQIKSLDRVANNVSDLSSKLDGQGSTGSTYERLFSTVQESHWSLETLAQRFDRTSSEQSKAIRDLTEHVSSLLTAGASYDGANVNVESLDTTVRELFGSLSSKLDQNAARALSDQKYDASEQQKGFDKLLAKFDNAQPDGELKTKVHELVDLVQGISIVDHTQSLESLTQDVQALTEKNESSFKDLSDRLNSVSSNGVDTDKLISKLDELQAETKEQYKTLCDIIVEKLASQSEQSAKTVSKLEELSSNVGTNKHDVPTGESDDVRHLVGQIQSTTRSNHEELKGLVEAANVKDLKELVEQVQTSAKSNHDEMKQLFETLQPSGDTKTMESIQELKSVLQKNNEPNPKVDDSKTLESIQELKGLLQKKGNDDPRSVDEDSQKLVGQVETLTKSNHDEVKQLFQSVEEKLSAQAQNDGSKVLGEIQADIRTLIDFQYGDSSPVNEKIGQIMEKLESGVTDKHSATRAAASEARAAELEKQLAQSREQHEKQIDELKKEYETKAKKSNSEAQSQLESTKKELQSCQRLVEQLQAKSNGKDDDNTGSGNAAEKVKLEEEVGELQNTRAQLKDDIAAMKAELSIRSEEFTKLESRIAKFEERLSHAILDRSKGILGSTTMTIINNTPKHGNALAYPERKSQPLKATSGSKRNLSFAPEELAEDLDDVLPLGKENSELSIAKRGSPFNKKGRSISLFVDH